LPLTSVRIDDLMARFRPLIGITTQSLHAIDGIPAGLPPSVVMNQRYYSAVTELGAIPVLIPLLHDDLDTLRALFDRLDGVLLPGGVDLEPSTYGEIPHERLGRTDPARDIVELQLARWSVEMRKPLLGLCRGLQVLNVAMGGTLWQDLKTQQPDTIKHDYFPTYGFERDHLAHDVDLVDGSRLRRAVGCARMAVNSMHHQGIRTLGDGLRPSAIAPDGIVEGIEWHEDAFIVGVQWHPEVFDSAYPHARPLFEEFVAAAAH
jgi:putative glutamine amidotransferase